MTDRPERSLFEPAILRAALLASLRKLDPRLMARNPVMFVVEVGAVFTTALWIAGEPGQPGWFAFTVAFWLWLTVLFGNFAEAIAEGRGKAQADALRAMRKETTAKLRDGTIKAASELTRGDVVVVEAGELIPGDGTVVEGIASVDESAITGESAPVIRESGGDRSAVTGGTRVLSDHIVVEITQEPGHSFLDRMIALVEGAERRKTPNEIALSILLAGLTIVFLVVVVALRPFGEYAGTAISITNLIALLVALIPTTIGALLSAIGIAGMDRLVRRNVLALSGRAVEASGDVDVLLLDKTGHDHARQPPGRRVRPDARRQRGRPRGGGADELAGRRDAGGPLDRRAGQAVRHPRARLRGPCAALRALHRADADERRRRQRHPPAQGRGGRDPAASSPRRAGRRRPSSRSSSTGSGARAGPRSPSPATARCWASCT